MRFCGGCGQESDASSPTPIDITPASDDLTMRRPFKVAFGVVGVFTLIVLGGSALGMTPSGGVNPLPPREWAGAVAALIEEIPSGPFGPAPSTSREEISSACAQLGKALDAYSDDVARAPTPVGRTKAAKALSLLRKAKSACDDWRARPASQALFDRYTSSKLAGMNMLVAAIESVAKDGSASEDTVTTDPEIEETVPTRVITTSTTTTAPEPQDFTTLSVGTCFNEPDEDAFAEVVPCTQSHKFEMLTEFDLWTDESRGDQYPGEAAIEREVSRRCVEAFESYVGAAYDDSRYDYHWWLPDSEQWEDGDGRVFCAIGIEGETLTGSAKNSRR